MDINSLTVTYSNSRRLPKNHKKTLKCTKDIHHLRIGKVYKFKVSQTNKQTDERRDRH